MNLRRLFGASAGWTHDDQVNLDRSRNWRGWGK